MFTGGWGTGWSEFENHSGDHLQGAFCCQPRPRSQVETQGCHCPVCMQLCLPQYLVLTEQSPLPIYREPHTLVRPALISDPCLGPGIACVFLLTLLVCVLE